MPRWRHFIIAGVILGVLGVLFAFSGAVPIAASRGHWAATAWFLHFTMQRSVSVRTLLTPVPPLDDPGLVLKGAGHYATYCVACHGSPDESRSPLVAQMTPEPPYLAPLIEQWKAEELFWIVKHGIKYSAMPGWIAQDRDDEVWAMVAFLRELPALDAQGFRALAYGDVTVDIPDASLTNVSGGTLRVSEAALAALANCARCHGVAGEGRGPGTFPALAGQREDYLRGSLHAYRNGSRASGIMQPIAAELRVEVIEELARYYARLPAGVAAVDPTDTADPQQIARGRAIARGGARAQEVPACVSCHGPRTHAHRRAYPRITGQHASYLALQLELFRDDRRGGTPYAHLMERAAERMTDEQIADVAAYYASLDPDPAAAARADPR